jgi:hypothetical protein
MAQVCESSAVAVVAVVYGTCSVDMKSLSCVLSLEKERSTCLELLLNLVDRVYLLVLLWFSRISLSKVKGA